MYSLAELAELRASAIARERQDGRLLAAASIGLAAVQLAFMGWAERRFPRDTALALEGGLFIAYMALVLWLLWRRQSHKASGLPRCPHCHQVLEDLSARLAIVTGKCDACGGQVIG